MAKVEPGRDPEMVQRTIRMNLVFALTSIALLITLSWMVWADYAREWKKYQIRFAHMEQDQTRQQVQAAKGRVDAAKAQQLAAQLAQGAQEEAQRRGQIKKL